MTTFEALQKANEMVRKNKGKKKKLASESNSTAVEKQKQKNQKAYERLKKRMAEDPELHEKRKAYMREYSKNMRDLRKENKMPCMSEENRVNWNLRRKERYANDPDYRERVLRGARKNREKRILRDAGIE